MPQEYRRNLLRSTDWYLVDYQARGKRTGIQKAKNTGMNEHLAKPFEMEKVLRAISRYHKV